MARASLTRRTLASDVVAQFVGTRVHVTFRVAARALATLAEDASAITVIVAGRSTLAPAAVWRIAYFLGIGEPLTRCWAGGALTKEAKNTLTFAVCCARRSILAEAPVARARLTSSRAFLAGISVAIAEPFVAKSFPVAVRIGFAHGRGESAEAPSCVQAGALSADAVPAALPASKMATPIARETRSMDDGLLLRGVMRSMCGAQTTASIVPPREHRVLTLNRYSPVSSLPKARGKHVVLFPRE
jgi:hypothetical protein